LSATIIRQQALEEREFDAKRAQLAALEAELTQRELDLATARAELDALHSRYVRIVGVKFAELDELQAQIAEAQARRNPQDAATPTGSARGANARAEIATDRRRGCEAE